MASPDVARVLTNRCLYSNLFIAPRLAPSRQLGVADSPVQPPCYVSQALSEVSVDTRARELHMLARQTPPPPPPQPPQPNTTIKVTITSNRQHYLIIHVVVSPILFSARESTVTPSSTHRRRRRKGKKNAILWALCGKFSIDAKLSSKIRSLDFVMSKLFPTRCVSRVNENLADRVSRPFCHNPTAKFLFGNNLGHIQIHSKIQRGDGYSTPYHVRQRLWLPKHNSEAMTGAQGIIMRQ